MKTTIRKWLEAYRCMDWAVLYLRMFAGGMMLFHNIGKMQNYNEIITSYPSLLYINNSATFVIITVAEVLLSVMLMIGLWVRMSALLLTLGIVLLFMWGGFNLGQLQFVWLGVYVFFVISGGGIYAFDEILTSPEKAKKRTI